MQERPPESEVPEDDDAAREAAAAAEFGAALEAFEAAPPPAAAAPVDAEPATPSGKAAKPLRLGQRIRGRVVTIGDDSVLVDIGARSEAVVEARELRNAEGALEVEPGQQLDLVVTGVGETITLGKGAAAKGGGSGSGRSRRALEAMRQAKDADLPVRGKVTGVNKGGLTVDVDGARGFCPLSQIDLAKVEDPAPLVGRVLEFLVTEVDPKRNNAVLSRRRYLFREQDQKAKDRVASLAPGQEVEGTVTRLEPFGAFIDVGGLEGLAHVTELSHTRVGHPRDVVAVGDHVHVKVLRVEEAAAGGKGHAKPRTRVSLSLKAATPDPWTTVAERFQPGARIPGVVVRLTDFGAFINLAPGIDGLVHVSQVSEQRITHVRDVLTPGQGVEVTVLAVEPEKRRVSLSMRESTGEPSIPPSRVSREDGPPRARGGDRDRSRPPRDRGGRGGDRPRGDRDRGDRDRGERIDRAMMSSRPTGPEPLTPMQLAFKRARESAEKAKTR